MPKTGLSAQELRKKVLDTAEDEIRKNGVERLKITDIAKELNVSHAALYKHFSDKNEIVAAISQKFLDIIDRDLEKISKQKKTSEERIIDFFITLHLLKRQKVLLDPKLYEAFNMSAEKISSFGVKHINFMFDLIEKIIVQGIKSKEFKEQDVKLSVQILFEATMAFHHPRLVLDHLKSDRTELLELVLKNLIFAMRNNIF